MASIPQQAEAAAPGSMILMGEYAVLEGSRAVMMTLRHRLTLTLRAADAMKIISDRFGTYTGGQKPPHATLLENAEARFFSRYGLPPQAFEIAISSAIPPTYGFGSSAALVAAMVKALHRFHGKAEVFREMFAIGHGAILDTFGRGSGADLAAALADIPFLVFDPENTTVSRFNMPFAVQAIYTGYKTPTPEVLKQVRAEVPEERWEQITFDMRACVDDFIKSPSVYAIGEYQKYMDALGVTCDACRTAIKAFSDEGATAKISGSGRGDCVVGFSSLPATPAVAPPLEFLSQRELRG